MKRRWLWATGASVVTLLVCLVLFYFAPAGKRAEERLVLWYAATECSAENMEALAALCEKETGLTVEAVGFKDEDALAEACAGERPNLLWCSHVRAYDMAAGGALEKLPDGAASPVKSTEGFFPLGARLPVLLRDPARLPEAPVSLEALLGAGEHVLAADCWADLLYEAMYALGRPMSGLSTADSANADYVRLHNRLARAAYDGAAVNDRPAADCVEKGLAAAAAVDSMALVGADAAFCVDPLPLPAGAEPRYAGVWMGFAVTKADTATALFLQWLSGREKSTALALSLGLVPFEPGAEKGKAPLEEALLAIGRGGTVSALDPGCSYLEHRDACEERLRLSLDLLA
jgi:hypothetical protein